MSQIEIAYLSRAKRGIALSSPDVQLALQWKRRGVPVHVVKRGIARAFDEWTRDEPPRGLRFAKATVEQAITAYVCTHPGSARAPSPEAAQDAPLGIAPVDPNTTVSERTLSGVTSCETSRQRLVSALSEVDEGRARAVIKAQIAVLNAPPPSWLSEPSYVVWNLVRAALLEGLERQLTDAERHGLRRSAQGSLRDIMAPDAALTHEAATFKRLLAAHFELSWLLA